MDLNLEQQVWLGSWWLPTAPDKPVSGEMRMVGDHFELRLLGNLPIETDEGSAGLRFSPTRSIFGWSSGRAITMHKNFLSETRFPDIRAALTVATPDRIQIEVWSCSEVVLDGHVGEDQAFQWASVSLPDLSEWWPTGVGRRRMTIDDLGELDPGGALHQLRVWAGQRVADPSQLCIVEGYWSMEGSGKWVDNCELHKIVGLSLARTV